MAHSPDPVDLAHYRDEGCRYAPACLRCPFAECLHDLEERPLDVLLSMRNDLMRQLYDRGATTVAIARRFGVARRTVYHALGGVRERRTARETVVCQNDAAPGAGAPLHGARPSG